MKAVRIHELGPAGNLRLDEIDKPVPGEGEVLIKNAAAGVNYADIARRNGSYLQKTPLPYVMGLEAAGTIETVGADVADFETGQRVLALIGSGGYAEYVAAPASQLFPIPDELGFGEASALLVQGLTAVGLLREARAGQIILIHAAAGGVGMLLVQLAKHRGLTVIGTASSPEKLEKVIELGADFGINYTEDDWTEQVLQATDNRGVDIIIEMVGGDIVEKNLKVLAVNGTMWVYGSASGQDYKLSVMGLLNKNHIVRGYWLTLETPAARAAYATELLDHIKAGRLKIQVTEFPLDHAAGAHKAIEGRKTTGKVVLTI
jgi:NADPH2:quinone reductase